MDAAMYVDIIKHTLKPFSLMTLDSHRFFQDNDPKHTSRLTSLRMESIGGKHPQNLPILNPIENFLHKQKEYLCHEVKPETKQQLMDGI